MRVHERRHIGEKPRSIPTTLAAKAPTTMTTSTHHLHTRIHGLPENEISKKVKADPEETEQPLMRHKEEIKEKQPMNDSNMKTEKGLIGKSEGEPFSIQMESHLN